MRHHLCPFRSFAFHSLCRTSRPQDILSRPNPGVPPDLIDLKNPTEGDLLGMNDSSQFNRSITHADSTRTSTPDGPASSATGTAPHINGHQLQPFVAAAAPSPTTAPGQAPVPGAPSLGPGAGLDAHRGQNEE